MLKSKIFIVLGLVLSSIIVIGAAHTTIYFCDNTNSDYNEDICRPHLDNPLVAYTFLLDYTLLLALTFISFVIIKYNIASLLKIIIQRTIIPNKNKTEYQYHMSKPDIVKQDNMTVFGFKITVNEKESKPENPTTVSKPHGALPKGHEKVSNTDNVSELEPQESSLKIIYMYVILSVIITLPTAFIMLQYTSTQFFDAVGISSYTKWFLANDKDTILSNVFFTYLDNVAFVILGMGALWVFLIRYVNKNQKNVEKLVGVSKLQNYLYISIVLVAAGVAIYAIDSYNITKEETLSETILYEESLQTDRNTETIVTTKVITKKTVETLNNESAFKRLQDKLSLALYEPQSTNAITLRLDYTIIFLVVVSALSGLIVSLFEIYVVRKIDY